MSGALPLGAAVEWTPARRPDPTLLSGAHVVVRPVEADNDAEALYAVSHPPLGDEGLWTYLPDGPYDTPEHLEQVLEWAEHAEEGTYFAIVPALIGEPAGIASYLRASPGMGSVELGHIWFGAGLARTTAATEAIYLLARHAFEALGYRRLEWKCDALNRASRRAAQRLGFTFEGTFRHHQIVKGRNRDTAWYAIIGDEWPAIRAGFERWLRPANFAPDGRQRRSLERCRMDAAR